MCEALKKAGISSTFTAGTGPVPSLSLVKAEPPVPVSPFVRIRDLLNNKPTTPSGVWFLSIERNALNPLIDEIEQLFGIAQRSAAKALADKSAIQDTLLEAVQDSLKASQELGRATELIGDLREGIEGANQELDRRGDRIDALEDVVDSLTRFDPTLFRKSAKVIRRVATNAKQAEASNPAFAALVQLGGYQNTANEMSEAARQLEESAIEIERSNDCDC